MCRLPAATGRLPLIWDFFSQAEYLMRPPGRRVRMPESRARRGSQGVGVSAQAPETLINAAGLKSPKPSRHLLYHFTRRPASAAGGFG